MNPSIEKLAETASKTEKTIIGLMSGTSLDGLDIALCNIRGTGTDTEVKLMEFETISYNETTKERLRTVTSVSEVSLENICLLHSWLGNYHGGLILDMLRSWNIDATQIDCIASHGQTIYHAPKKQHKQLEMPNATLQIGDGDHIARSTGILTISDFRQKHTAAGGEGAPMVSFVDRLLYTHKSEDRILLNIGGIANFTYLPSKDDTDRSLITTDTGPGNTLIDAAVKKYFDKEYDTDGAIAQRGTVQTEELKMLKSDPYFQRKAPKTTGPEVFNLSWVYKRLAGAGFDNLEAENLVATLTRLSAETIARSIRNIPGESRNPTIFVSGGGLHNPVLMEWIQELLPGCKVKDFNAIGFNPDAKEAVLFAVLANEALSGNGFPMNVETDSSKINFGKISFPS